MGLSIHLFYGHSTDAVQGQLLRYKSSLQPLVERRSIPGENFPIGQKISVEVSINENKNVHLEFSTVINNRVYDGNVHLNLGSSESVSELGAGGNHTSSQRVEEVWQIKAK